MRFGLVLVTRSSSFRKNAGWKEFMDSVSSSTGLTDALELYASDQPVYGFFSVLGFSAVLQLHRCFNPPRASDQPVFGHQKTQACASTRLTDVFTLVNIGLTSAYKVRFCCLSGQLHRR